MKFLTLMRKKSSRPSLSIAFEMPEVGTRKVYHDCHIYVNHNYYSVPFEYVGKEVEIELKKDVLKVIYQGNVVTVHPKAEGQGNHITNNSHYPKYKMFSQTEYQEKYQLKMSEIGPFAQQVFFIIVENAPLGLDKAGTGNSFSA